MRFFFFYSFNFFIFLISLSDVSSEEHDGDGDVQASSRPTLFGGLDHHFAHVAMISGTPGHFLSHCYELACVVPNIS